MMSSDKTKAAANTEAVMLLQNWVDGGGFEPELHEGTPYGVRVPHDPSVFERVLFDKYAQARDMLPSIAQAMLKVGMVHDLLYACTTSAILSAGEQHPCVTMLNPRQHDVVHSEYFGSNYLGLHSLALCVDTPIETCLSLVFEPRTVTGGIETRVLEFYHDGTAFGRVCKVTVASYDYMRRATGNPLYVDASLVKREDELHRNPDEIFSPGFTREVIDSLPKLVAYLEAIAQLKPGRLRYR